MDLTVNQAGYALRRFESYPLHSFQMTSASAKQPAANSECFGGKGKYPWLQDSILLGSVVPTDGSLGYFPRSSTEISSEHYQTHFSRAT
jgi:hypothetical protein